MLERDVLLLMLAATRISITIVHSKHYFIRALVKEMQEKSAGLTKRLVHNKASYSEMLIFFFFTF